MTNQQFKVGDTVRLLRNVRPIYQEPVTRGSQGTVISVADDSQYNRERGRVLTHYKVRFGSREISVLPEDMEPAAEVKQ